MASSADQRKLLEDFFLLQDRAATLFSGLKDLPEHGSQWETHFARTFEIYTKVHMAPASHHPSPLYVVPLPSRPRNSPGDCHCWFSRCYYEDRALSVV